MLEVIAVEQLDVDAAVIGSGFGGAVAAARLAQAGLSVVVLERGRRWEPGQFPRDLTSLERDWLWSKDRGLYDIRWLDRMVGVQAAGWGGGSLVYANVFARPPREAFDQWPAGYDRDTLDPYYDLAAHMLRVSPVGPDPLTGRVPARTAAMEHAVSRLRHPAGTVRPLLAVTFARDPERPGVGECTFCGECMFGCNQGAKNSVDRSYLEIALDHGAIARTLCEVDRIEKTASGFQVGYVDHASGIRGSVRARQVFLAAGAVATTELLLRNRDVHGTLPDLSPTLGRGFSGNGDFLAFVSRPRVALEPGRGPTITTSTIVDCRIGAEDVWFQVQDGAYPAQIAELIRTLNPLRRRAASPVRTRKRATSSHDTMALLMMGRDSSDGLLTLDHQGEARLAWRNRPNSALYRAQMRAAREAARELGGRVRSFASWALLRTPVTVHNLGGAPIGDHVGTGVIDPDGQVHGYPGLHVVDGAGIPASTGANPSATILAVAERRVERAIRRLTGEESWTAPEWMHVRPVPAPEDDAVRAVRQRRRARGRASGPSPRPVRFREVMTGSVSSEADAGASVGTPLRLRLAVQVPDGGVGLGDVGSVASVSGTGELGGARVRVTGRLELFPGGVGDGVYMRYALRYTDGRRCHGILAGVKSVSGGPVSLAHDLTTLAVTMQHSEGGAVSVASGSVRISAAGVVALVASLRAGDGVSWHAARDVARFARRFLRAAAARSAVRRSASGQDGRAADCGAAARAREPIAGVV